MRSLSNLSTHPTVQDMAFQLERLVGSMYVYNRQCHKAFKQAAVFPIEVQLTVDSIQQQAMPTMSLIEPEEEQSQEEVEKKEEEEEEEEEKGEEEEGKEPQEDLLIQTDWALFIFIFNQNIFLCFTSQQMST